MMGNNAVYWAVSRAYWNVNGDLYEAMYGTVFQAVIRDVEGAVYWAVDRAVDMAVSGALYWAVYGDVGGAVGNAMDGPIPTHWESWG
jgi:hypothetical protein